MKIAILGIRGIPAKYGGFETFAEQLAPRLVSRGHDVTVYGRCNMIKDYKTGDKYLGVRLVILPTVSHKYLDTPVHTILCVFHSLLMSYEVILMCNAANSIFSFIPRIRGQKVVMNVDGIERKRKKWNWIAKLWYWMGEGFSCFMPNQIVTDAKAIQDYYIKMYNKKSIMIPYGYCVEKIYSNEILKKYNVSSGDYILCVGRLEPENNAHIVIQAFKKVNTKKKLIIIGDVPYASEYKGLVNNLAKDDPRILLVGYIFGDGYKELQNNAYCYIHAGEVGGTPPALVEAMGFGNCIIVNGTSENQEVIDKAGLVYEFNNIQSLKEKIDYVLNNIDIKTKLGAAAEARAKQVYSWDIVTDKYENLFKNLFFKI